jgi:endonuclease YncB( thermonuclease family)
VGQKRLIAALAVVIAAGLAGLWLARDDDSPDALPTGDYEYLDPALTNESQGSTGIASVASVTDGDTIRLAGGHRVRLVQIDAPERSTECFGDEARRALMRLVAPGSQVVLAWDDTVDKRDAYGRLLRYAFVGTSNVNVTLVRSGAAVPYFFHGRRGLYADQLFAAARKARSERRGLWGACPGAKLDPRRGALTGPA